MTRSRFATVSLTAAMLIAATPALATGSAHTERLVHFVLPGRDTECQMVEPNLLNGNITCGIHRNLNRCPGYCGIEWEASRRWSLSATGIAAVFRSPRNLGTGPPRVLRFGHALTVGYFRCTSHAAGLMCVSRHSGHGFFLSTNNKSQTVW
jgi:hypothetical protein